MEIRVYRKAASKLGDKLKLIKTLSEVYNYQIEKLPFSFVGHKSCVTLLKPHRFVIKSSNGKIKGVISRGRDASLTTGLSIASAGEMGDRILSFENCSLKLVLSARLIIHELNTNTDSSELCLALMHFLFSTHLTDLHPLLFFISFTIFLCLYRFQSPCYWHQWLSLSLNTLNQNGANSRHAMETRFSFFFKYSRSIYSHLIILFLYIPSISVINKRQERKMY